MSRVIVPGVTLLDVLIMTDKSCESLSTAFVSLFLVCLCKFPFPLPLSYFGLSLCQQSLASWLNCPQWGHGSSSHLSQSFARCPCVLQCLQYSFLVFLSVCFLLSSFNFVSLSFDVMHLRRDCPFPLLFFTLIVKATFVLRWIPRHRLASVVIMPMNSYELMFLNGSRVAWRLVSVI